MVATSPSKPQPGIGSYILSDGPAGFLLSWVAGFVDVSAFIILFGIFTAHVTGNIALAGYSFCICRRRVSHYSPGHAAGVYFDRSRDLAAGSVLPAEGSGQFLQFC